MIFIFYFFHAIILIMDYFTSDLHLAHENCVHFRKKIKNCPFNNLTQMNDLIYENFSHFEKKDRVFLLGDIAWNKEELTKFFNHLHSQKIEIHWILGNHDKSNCYPVSFTYPVVINDVEVVKSNSTYKSIFLSHYQHLIWDRSHYGIYHLFGHSHQGTQDRLYSQVFEGLEKSLNVNLEFYDYKPISRDSVEKILNCKERDNIDHYLFRIQKHNEDVPEHILKRFSSLRTELAKLHVELSEYCKKYDEEEIK